MSAGEQFVPVPQHELAAMAVFRKSRHHKGLKGGGAVASSFAPQHEHTPAHAPPASAAAGLACNSCNSSEAGGAGVGDDLLDDLDDGMFDAAPESARRSITPGVPPPKSLSRLFDQPSPAQPAAPTPTPAPREGAGGSAAAGAAGTATGSACTAVSSAGNCELSGGVPPSDSYLAHMPSFALDFLAVPPPPAKPSAAASQLGAELAAAKQDTANHSGTLTKARVDGVKTSRLAQLRSGIGKSFKNLRAGRASRKQQQHEVAVLG